MESAQDGTFTCVGYMEGTGPFRIQPLPSGYECILCVRPILVRHLGGLPEA